MKSKEEINNQELGVQLSYDLCEKLTNIALAQEHRLLIDNPISSTYLKRLSELAVDVGVYFKTNELVYELEPYELIEAFIKINFLIDLLVKTSTLTNELEIYQKRINELIGRVKKDFGIN